MKLQKIEYVVFGEVDIHLLGGGIKVERTKLGETWAVSPAQAANNVRFRDYGRKTAEELGFDRISARPLRPVKTIPVQPRPQPQQTELDLGDTSGELSIYNLPERKSRSPRRRRRR